MIPVLLVTILIRLWLMNASIRCSVMKYSEISLWTASDLNAQKLKLSRGLLRLLYMLILCHSSCFESKVKPRVCLVIGCLTAISSYALIDL